MTEESIDLNTIHTTSPEEIKQHKTPNISANFPSDQSAEDFIKTILHTPTEQLIPWEECTLPSKGLYYNWADGNIMIRAMGQVAEKILATQRLAQSGQSIDYLFKECCKFPDGFTPEELLGGDRVFILYYLRGITHGNDYEFAVTCPNTECGQLLTQTYDLNQLASTIVWADASLGDEPFKVVLPYMSETTGREVFVGVKFLRGYDLNDILARRRLKKKMVARPGVRTRSKVPTHAPVTNQSLDEALNENLEKMIVHVQGLNSTLIIKEFIKKLHAKDLATIREWSKDHTPGIDNTVTITCSHCQQEFTIELPITESFFRPTKPGGV